MRQPLTSFSTFFIEIRRYSLHLSFLCIWFVGNSKVFRIFYIESRIGDEKFASLIYFFFLFFSLFDGINPWWWVFNPWWWKFAYLLFFSLFDVWVSILFDLLKPVVMGFQPWWTCASLFAGFSFFSLFDV